MTLDKFWPQDITWDEAPYYQASEVDALLDQLRAILERLNDIRTRDEALIQLRRFAASLETKQQ